MVKTVLTVGMALGAGMLSAFCAGCFCDAYLGEAQQKPLSKLYLKKYWGFFTSFAVIAVIGGFLFCQYQYSVTEIIRRFVVLYIVLAIARIDKKKYIIPNMAVLLLFSAQIVLLAIEFFVQKDLWIERMFSSALGLLIGGITFLVGYFISHGGMGLGDVKLLAAMGFLLGDGTVVPIIMLSLLLSAVYGIIQLLRKKLKAKDEVPYAPFVACASVILILFGF